MLSPKLDALSLVFRRDDNTVVIRVDGEVDVATAPLLERALVSVIDEQGNLFVRLDLSRMSFVDSTGLAVLARALNRARARDGDLTLANPQPYVERIFRIAGFSEMFALDGATLPT